MQGGRWAAIGVVALAVSLAPAVSAGSASAAPTKKPKQPSCSLFSARGVDIISNVFKQSYAKGAKWVMCVFGNQNDTEDPVGIDIYTKVSRSTFESMKPTGAVPGRPPGPPATDVAGLGSAAWFRAYYQPPPPPNCQSLTGCNPPPYPPTVGVLSGSTELQITGRLLDTEAQVEALARTALKRL
jgi:hypothetical protein